MAKIQRPLRIPLQAKVNRLDPCATRAVVVRIALELQTRSPETILRLEDALVADCDLKRLVSIGIKSCAPGGGGELDDIRPLEFLALDVLGVELGRTVRVEIRGYRSRRDAAVEDNGTLHLPRSGYGVNTWWARFNQDGSGAEGQAEEHGGVMHRAFWRELKRVACPISRR